MRPLDVGECHAVPAAMLSKACCTHNEESGIKACRLETAPATLAYQPRTVPGSDPPRCTCLTALPEQVLVTCNDFMDKDFKSNLCATVEDLLNMGTVPIFNENDSISKGAKAKKVVTTVS